MRELEGKVAIVTGAGRLRGIGRAAAVSLARLGANVVITGTGRDPANYPPNHRPIQRNLTPRQGHPYLWQSPRESVGSS